jgi:hypothetical protein
MTVGKAGRNETMGRTKHRTPRALCSRWAAAFLIVMLAGACGSASVAQAAAPAWKLLALTGPTNLPPVQSEIQRVTVGEAEGGTFIFKLPGGEGRGTPVLEEGGLAFTAGSTEATILSGSFEVGDYVFQSEEAVPYRTIVVGCSTDCTTPGSTVTLSNPAEFTFSDPEVSFIKPELRNVTGTFHAGEQISGTYLLPGTVVTSVGSGTLRLSDAPTFFFAMPIEGFQESSTVPFNASPKVMQAALEALPALGAGNVEVSGGPGGSAGSPYFVDFGGSLADENVPQLKVNSAGLEGAHAYGRVFTVVPGGNGTGEIAVAPTNVGGSSTVGPATVEIGPLPAGIVFSGETQSEGGWSCPGATGASTAICTSSIPVPALSDSKPVSLPIEITSPAPLTATVPVSIEGAMARPDHYQMALRVSSEQAPFGTQAFWAEQFDENGNPDTRAGAHPYSAMSYFELNTVRDARGQIVPAADSKDVIVDLSPGFVGNPMVLARCPQAQVVADPNVRPEACGPEMTIGLFDAMLNGFGLSFPVTNIWNDVPPKGYAAEFTALIAIPTQSLLASVRSESDYGIRITAPNTPAYEKIYGSFAALEGFPAGSHGKPFLTNASDCANEAVRHPLVSAQADTWTDPGNFTPVEAELEPVSGCDQLKFQGDFTFQPTSDNGSTAVGATAHLHLPQEGLVTAGQLAQPDLKAASVKLPAGLVLNPSSANGLEACTEEQMGYRGNDFEEPNPIRFNGSAPNCPDGSKLGTVEVKTPLLDHPMPGTIYLASQYENPFNSLLGIYLVINDESSGILIKLPGAINIGANGQMTAVFDHNPQLPFEDLTLNFRGGGPRSELATPEVCGTYTTDGEWTPWSAPESGPPLMTEDSFTVSNGCSSSAQSRPFSPSFEAGTTGTQAGAYSPLVVKVGRKDGEQELTSLDFTLPKGLIGKLAGIPYCSDGAIVAAEHKSGKEEQANPSCPAASQIGSVDTAAGIGSEPFHVGGKLYLSGPYKGAPVSAVVVSPAVAGPLDLGDVVVRTPLFIDHETAVLTAKSDPIPTSLKGIQLKVRSVSIDVDRPGFMLNPTNCTPMTASASIGSSNGATAKPSNRFQVGGCEKLKFAPNLSISLKGSSKRNGNPALTAVLKQAPGQANIGRVSVALPHSEFLEQSHIRTNCTRVQFAAEQCPKGSIYGEAEAISPLLDQPLRGPVYLRSSSHRLPDLVAALKGPPSQPIEIDLDGRIDSFKGGIRTTFEAVPDAPVSKFVLKMRGGKKSLLVNSTNICKGKNRANVEMVGQSGKEHNFNPVVEPQCKKKAKGGGKKKGKK